MPELDVFFWVDFAGPRDPEEVHILFFTNKQTMQAAEFTMIFAEYNVMDSS